MAVFNTFDGVFLRTSRKGSIKSSFPFMWHNSPFCRRTLSPSHLKAIYLTNSEFACMWISQMRITGIRWERNQGIRKKNRERRAENCNIQGIWLKDKNFDEHLRLKERLLWPQASKLRILTSSFVSGWSRSVELNLFQNTDLFDVGQSCHGPARTGLKLESDYLHPL